MILGLYSVFLSSACCCDTTPPSPVPEQIRPAQSAWRSGRCSFFAERQGRELYKEPKTRQQTAENNAHTFQAASHRLFTCGRIWEKAMPSSITDRHSLFVFPDIAGGESEQATAGCVSRRWNDRCLKRSSRDQRNMAFRTAVFHVHALSQEQPERTATLALTQQCGFWVRGRQDFLLHSLPAFRFFTPSLSLTPWWHTHARALSFWCSYSLWCCLQPQILSDHSLFGCGVRCTCSACKGGFRRVFTGLFPSLTSLTLPCDLSVVEWVEMGVEPYAEANWDSLGEASKRWR